MLTFLKPPPYCALSSFTTSLCLLLIWSAISLCRFIQPLEHLALAGPRSFNSLDYSLVSFLRYSSVFPLFLVRVSLGLSLPSTFYKNFPWYLRDLWMAASIALKGQRSAELNLSNSTRQALLPLFKSHTLHPGALLFPSHVSFERVNGVLSDLRVQPLDLVVLCFV